MALRTDLFMVKRVSETMTTPTPTTATPTASTDSPFFATSLTPPPTSSESAQRSALSKSVLEWIFFVIALGLIALALTCRSFQLRRRNRPLTDFFRFSRSGSSLPTRRQPIPRTTGLPALTQPLRPVSLTHEMLYPTLTPLPTAYARRQARRTRAADTDEGGRRAGGGDDDWNGDRKDILPAYDNVNGPPKYVELEMEDARARLHLHLAGALGNRGARDGSEAIGDTPTQHGEEVPHQSVLETPSLPSQATPDDATPENSAPSPNPTVRNNTDRVSPGSP